MSECKTNNVDNHNGRNFKSHAEPAERFLTVSSPFMVETQDLMGNPNCCFIIIAGTFFLSSQSPRGTVK